MWSTLPSTLAVLSSTVALLVFMRETWLGPHPNGVALSTVGPDRANASSGRCLNAQLLFAVGTPNQHAAPSGADGVARRRRDPLRAHRAVVGRDAHTPWYVRVRAAALLLLIVIAAGALLAGFTLLIIASGRVLLETLAG